MARVKTDQTARRAREIFAEPYTQVLTRDQSGYSAEILEFPGCFASGDTAEEACRNLENAALSWIESELAKGASIPAPLKHYQASGAYLWRPPRSLQARAMAIAAMEGVSLNQYLSAVVAESIGARAVQAYAATAPYSFSVVVQMGAPTTPLKFPPFIPSSQLVAGVTHDAGGADTADRKARFVQ